MSRGERFFTPKSLARVAESVEWEDVLEYYPDGSSNQQQFMRALGILFERWMREWQLPDAREAWQNLADQKYADQLMRILDTMVVRTEQIVGFFRGLWAGANPGWRAPRNARGRIDPKSFVVGDQLNMFLRWWIERMRLAVADPMEGMTEEVSDG